MLRQTNKFVARFFVAMLIMMLPLSLPAFSATAEDKALQNQISERINKGGNKFYISVRDGVATLGGQADSEAERLEAVAKAKSVKGVKSVNDNIRVLAADEDEPSVGQAVDDSVITAQVKGKIMLQQGVNAFDIHVNTVDGVVMLTGRVDNPEQVSLAGKAAQSVSGVKKVDNRLVARYK